MFVHSFLLILFHFPLFIFFSCIETPMIHVNCMKGVHQSLGKLLLPLFVIFVPQNSFFLYYFVCSFPRNWTSLIRVCIIMSCFELWVAVRFYSWFTFSESNYNMHHTIGSYDTKQWQFEAAEKRKIEKFLNCVNYDKHTSFQIPCQIVVVIVVVVYSWGLRLDGNIHIIIFFFLKNNINEKNKIISI